MSKTSMQNQRGYVLLLMLLTFMGVGGVVLAGFTQQAKQELEAGRYEHNQRVLEQAKQALLMFAYNYPQTNGGGPGRLPCPDHDNDGAIDFPLNCGTVGRFPWADARLNIEETLDASGERLWYAVSDTFDNFAGGGVINSDTVGAITLVDQSGGILYDGAVAGIAAVIIAPGPITRRDEDANGTYEFTQLRNTNPQRNDPRNYLDTFNGFDNSVFVNGSNAAADGFILGPVIDIAQDQIVVNDQLIIITADEVIAMAEKAVLAAYKDAIDVYQNNAWAGVAASYRYPWLNAYADIADLNVIDAEAGETVGRVPYLNYYTDHDSHVVITDLQIDFDFTLTSMTDANDAVPGYIDAFTGAFNATFFNGTRTLDISDSNLSFQNENFAATDDSETDDTGTLVAATGGTAVVNAAPSSTLTIYFWDGCPTCTQALPADGWQVCPFVNGDETDCARDNATGTVFEQPFLGWGNHYDMKIRVVTLRLDMDPDFVIEFDDYGNPPALVYTAPTAAENARFTATHNVATIDFNDLKVANTAETNARNLVDVTVQMCEQDNVVQGGYNIPSSNPDGDSVFCALDLDTTFNVNQLDITADYYPEIPLWVRQNGWGNSVLMAYADDYSPAIVTPPDCVANPPCITVDHIFDDVNDENVMVLVGAREIPASVVDLVNNIFEGENNSPLDDTFDAHPNPGDDIILVYDEI